MTDKKIYIIVAVDENNGIGKTGRLPWHFKKEMAYFRDTTSETTSVDAQNMVVMGRKTWESIDPKYRPLKDRRNSIVTRNQHYKAQGATVCFSLGEALRNAELDEKIENIFIIGGAQIFDLAIPIAHGIYLTRIQKSYDCDTFFPAIPDRYVSTPENLGFEEEDGVKYTFEFFPLA